MEIINFRQIIDQEFEASKPFSLLIGGKGAEVMIKKFSFAIRNRIEKLNKIGIKTKYEYETVFTDGAEDLRVKSATTEHDESFIDAEEKVFDLILTYGLDTTKQNLQKNPMTIKDWRDFATYFPKEFKELVNEILEFNGLIVKK